MDDGNYQTLFVMGSVHHNPSPAATSPTRRKIKSFRDLPEGWHYGEGGPISKHIRDLGLGLLDEMHSLGLTKTDAFPSQDGGMMIAAYHGEHCMEVMIEHDGKQHLSHERDGDEVWAGEGNGKKLIRERAREIFETVWRLSVSSTQNTMTPNEAASLVWRSRILPTEVVPQSLTQHAWMRNSA